MKVVLGEKEMRQRQRSWLCPLLGSQQRDSSFVPPVTQGL